MKLWKKTATRKGRRRGANGRVNILRGPSQRGISIKLARASKKKRETLCGLARTGADLSG